VEVLSMLCPFEFLHHSSIYKKAEIIIKDVVVNAMALVKGLVLSA